MNDQFFYYALGFGVAVLLYYAVTRWAHEIAKRNRYMEAQIKLLTKIARKQGVEERDLKKILNDAMDSEDAL